MSDCTWSLFLFEKSGVPKAFKGKTIVLLKLIPDGINIRNMSCISVVEKLGYNNLKKIAWQYDKKKYMYTNIDGGCGTCWDYFAQDHRYSYLFKYLPKTFDLDAISKLDEVLILDKDGNVINTTSSSSALVAYGATCKKCNDYNPYAEATTGEDFLCYKCRNGY